MMGIKVWLLGEMIDEGLEDSIINRRDFLKGIIGTGVSSIMPAPFLSERTFNSGDRKQSPASVEFEEVPKERRIYYLSDNVELYMQIYRYTLSIGCEIFSLRPYSADGKSLNGFMYIIDRNFVGKEWWDRHIRCCDKYGWREPCLLIDTIKDMDMPQSNLVKQFDVNNPSSINALIYIMKEACVQNTLRNHCDPNNI